MRGGYCSISGKLKHCDKGGNKRYNYGFVSGTAEYCWILKEWVHEIKKCPKAQEVEK